MKYLNYKFMKNSIAFLFSVFVAVALCSCDPIEDENEVIDTAENINISDDERESGFFNFAFSLKLLDKLNVDKSKNVVISPLNLMVTNGIYLNGTKDETQRELLTAIGYEGDLADFNSYIKTVNSEFKRIDPTSKFLSSSSLWIDNKDSNYLESIFNSVMDEYYDLDIFSSFDLSSDKAKNAINGWVSENTNNQITKILDTPLGDETKCFQASALYFKGIWKTPFDKSRTQEENFTNTIGSTSKVAMMNADIKLVAIKEPEYSAVKIPMGNKAFQLIVVLPEDGVSLEDCAKHLTEKRFNSFCYGFEESLIHLKLPKFEVNGSNDMLEAYKQLGVNRLFDPTLSQICMLKGNQCSVGFLNQAVRFSIDEDGCTAANVVYSGLDAAALPLAPKEMDFKVDKPFIFMVKEKSTPCPLILGYINNLSK